MTPDVQAAADRVHAFLDTWERIAGHPAADVLMTLTALEPPTGTVRLTRSDLRTLLAALDPAEQPIRHIPTKAGLNYLEIRRRQNPRNRQP